MPRKVDPHWGEDGFEDVKPVELKADQAAELASLLAFAPRSKQASEIQAAVQEIGTCYRNWRRRGAAAFNRAEARESLEQILRRDRLDYGTLSSLNGRAFQCLHDALTMMRPAPVSQGDTVFAALMEDRLAKDVIRAAIHDTIERLKASKGPDREGDIAWAVAELCRLYEVLTGRPATHSNKGKLLAYHIGPRSRAGRFVEACFALIDKEVRATQISSAMRLYVEGRKKG